MAIRIPKEIHQQEFAKLKQEYERQFGDVADQDTAIYYSKTELVHTYAQNLLFWSSRLIDDPQQMRQMKDVARRAICENSCVNIRKYLKENKIEDDVNAILEQIDDWRKK